MNKTWLSLKKGDVIEIVALASASTKAQLKKQFVLKKIGLKPSVPQIPLKKCYVSRNGI